MIDYKKNKAPKKTPYVVMVGPDLDVKGGISTVVNNWIATGLRDGIQLKYIATLKDGSPGRYLGKTLEAIMAYIQLFSIPPKRIDLVHIHLSSGMSFYRKFLVFIYARIIKTKIVTHLHGSIFKEFYHQGGKIRKSLIQKMFNDSNIVIALSVDWKKFIQDISSNNNIHIIHNSSAIKISKPKTYKDQINILFMGRIGKRKGTFDLLRAFQLLHQKVPRAHLYIGGDGEIEQLRTISRHMGIETHVHIMGWITGSRRQEVFEQSHIYVLPSYNEGLPGSILEAMATGNAIVSTPVGGIPEAVIDQRNGYLVAPGDVNAIFSALLKLCHNMETCKKMGQESIKIMEEKFDIKLIVDDLTSLYKELSSSQ